MKSFILASLVALALAATPAFEHTYEPKNEYVYKFDGLILSGLPTSQPTDMAQTRISARARLQSIDDRHIHLQLIKIEVAALNTIESSEEQYPSLESRELKDEHRELLELPVRAQIKNGLVSEIQFSNEDSEWSKNVKRSVLNMISFVQKQPTDEVESQLKNNEQELQSFFINEKTIEGDCQVAYTINREDSKTIITKSVNFDKCTSRPQIVYGEQFLEPVQQREESFKPQTVYTYTLEGELLKEVEVRSIYTHSVNGQEVMKTETRSKLTHEETVEINKEIKKVQGEPEEIVYSTKWEESVEDFFKNGDAAEVNPFKHLSSEKKLEIIKEIFKGIPDKKNNEPETVHQFARLVQILRTATQKELKEWNDDHKTQEILNRAFAIAGTRNTIEHLIKNVIEKEYVSPIMAAQLLKSIQETPYPSEKIAEILIKFAQSQKEEFVLRQSAWLAAGSVVRGVVSQKVQQNQLIRENTRDLKQKFLRVFLDLFRDSEETYEKVLALKTLGNSGIDISVNEIISIINDQRQPLIVRREAVDCLRLLDNIMPLKLQRVLLPIYKNRQNAPELRMAALWRLIQTRPQQSVLTQIVYQMEKESNQQVQQFTFHVLKQFSKSTNPQYQQLAADCADVLSFTQYRLPKETPVNSWFAQLPLFAQELLSGVQFDSLRMSSKNSYLPKEIQLSLESVFGENWNKYLAQIGFNQQSWETRNVQNENRRDSENKFNVVSDLAKKLNIAVRKNEKNEDSFAMAYLRYKNMDYLVLPIDEEFSQMINKLRHDLLDSGNKKELKMDEHHFAAFFYEIERRIPTTLGLPITISGKVPTIASIEGKVSLKNKRMNSEIHVDVKPSIAASHIFEMRMMTPLFEQGVKSIQSFTSYTPLNFELTMEMSYPEATLKSKITVPNHQKSSVKISSRPVVFIRFPGESKTTEEKTVIVKRLDDHTIQVSETLKMFGLEFAAQGNWMRQWSVENVLLAAQDMEFTIVNKHKTVEFSETAVIKINKEVDSEQFFKQLLNGKPSELLREPLKQLKELKKDVTSFIGVDIENTLKGPEDHEYNVDVKVVGTHQMSQWKIDIRRPDNKWTLNTEIIELRPDDVWEMEQLREPKGQIIMKTQWGASNKKNTWEMVAQLGQSAEQKKYQQKLERQTEMPEYERLVKSARLNQLDVVAQYKLDQSTEQVLNYLCRPLNRYLNKYMSVEDQQNEDNQVQLKLTVDPITRRYVNVTIQTPEQQYQLENTEIPKITLPTLAHSKVSMDQPRCEVTRKNVKTFDDLVYSAPLTSCYSVIAKDCSEHPKFAVLAKRDSKDSDLLKIKVLYRNTTFVSTKRNGRYMFDKETEHSSVSHSTAVDATLAADFGEVTYDGESVTFIQDFTNGKMPLCGLCGNHDDNAENDMKTARGEETDDIETFHRSFMLDDEECEIEEDVVSDKKNYRKMSRSQRYSSEEQDNEYETEEKENKENNLIKRTEVKEFSHRICFSLEGVPACRRNYDEQETVEKKVKFTCLPRHDSEARRLLKAANKDTVLDLKSRPVSFVEPITVPTQCEYAY